MDENSIVSPARPGRTALDGLAGVTGVEVLQGIAAAAGLIAALKSILDGNSIDEQLDAILTELLQQRQELIRATADILEAIDGIHRDINENTADDNIALADVALFNDLALLGNKQAAMTRSFQAADRLALEREASFATAFMYVVNIRLAVLKEFDPGYYCNEQFIEEFRRYIAHLERWIDEFNSLIRRSHTVSVELIRIRDGDREFIGWEGKHLRDGIVVLVRTTLTNDDNTRQRLLAQMNASRQAGIGADRGQFGVVDMEATARAWRRAFDTNRRQALIRQVLDRRTMAIDFHRDGLMVDGRIVPDGAELRSMLHTLLTSAEFRRRIQGAWTGFVDDSQDRLAHFAVRRLFNRDATAGEVELLRRIGADCGYSAFIGALIFSDEYEKRYGRGLPPGGAPLLEALELPEPPTE